MVIAALALLACALFFAPIANTQSGVGALSPTPPVTLAPPSKAPASTTKGPTATTPQTQQLPKTGLDLWHVALAGLGLLLTGMALRRAGAGPTSRRSR